MCLVVLFDINPQKTISEVMTMIILAILLMLVSFFCFYLAILCFDDGEGGGVFLFGLLTLFFGAMGCSTFVVIGENHSIGRNATVEELKKHWTYEVLLYEPNHSVTVLKRPDGIIQSFKLNESLCVGGSYTVSEKKELVPVTGTVSLDNC